MNKTARDIIKRPLITEKSMLHTVDNAYTFEVDPRANKHEIRRAIEEIFKVKVLKVNTSMMRGKMRRSGRTQGRTSDWKKVRVTLRQGDKIEIGGIDYFEH